MMKLVQIWQDVRSSLWFVPGLLVLGAVVIAIALIEADGYMERGLLDQWPRLFGSSASGARNLLTAVAGSMITVAGVVFSITIVALSLTSSQYTSRVLRNFMSNPVNQTVLGVFVGIFAYCLVVLRTIRGGDEGAFVPSLAVLFGLLLAFLGIAVLIYFIHHISASIQAAHILAAVTKETLEAVDVLFPDDAGEEANSTLPVTNPGQAWYPISASKTGYLQSLDPAGLLAFARERRTVVRMERGVGQFLIEETPIASLLGTAAPSDDDRKRLGEFYAVGPQRTMEQDAAFGIRQIVDVALKALSPGINDTTTAVMCIDHLTAILVRLTDRRIESCYRADDGELRLLTCGPTYFGMVGEAFDQIRQNADGNVAVLEGLLGSLELLAGRTVSPARRLILAGHAEAVLELGRRSIPAPRDRQRFESRSARVMGLFTGDAATRLATATAQPGP
ncbi:MAG: DUF2254 domain-containing protein [Thiobacillus sp.]